MTRLRLRLREHHGLRDEMSGRERRSGQGIHWEIVSFIQDSKCMQEISITQLPISDLNDNVNKHANMYRGILTRLHHLMKIYRTLVAAESGRTIFLQVQVH